MIAHLTLERIKEIINKRLHEIHLTQPEFLYEYVRKGDINSIANYVNTEPQNLTPLEVEKLLYEIDLLVQQTKDQKGSKNLPLLGMSVGLATLIASLRNQLKLMNGRNQTDFKELFDSSYLLGMLSRRRGWV